MRELFQADLSTLGDQLSEITTLVRRAMERAKVCFETSNVQLAEEVISEDSRIDFLQNALDEKAIELLALQAPVASDLRTVVASLRMSTSLERMGDLARHIAQLTRMRYPDPVVPDRLHDTFAEMAQLCVDVGRELEELLSTQDLQRSKAVVELNTKINEIHSSNFAAVADPSWDVPATQTADVTLASRYFERFADHGVSVARKVNYLVTGEWEPRI